jgi:hypothetical protein
MAVGLDVVDEELVLLRRPGPLLEALVLVAAGCPSHRLGRRPPNRSRSRCRLALRLFPTPTTQTRVRALKLTRRDDTKHQRSRGAQRRFFFFCLVGVMCVGGRIGRDRRGVRGKAAADDEEGFVCGRGGSPGCAINGGDFHLLPATRRRSRRVAWGKRKGREGMDWEGSSAEASSSAVLVLRVELGPCGHGIGAIPISWAG